jgi:hypothetical protein
VCSCWVVWGGRMWRVWVREVALPCTHHLPARAGHPMSPPLCLCGCAGMHVHVRVRYEIFCAFDDVLFLGKGGRTVYLGPTAQALPYFEERGIVCPPLVNPPGTHTARSALPCTMWLLAVCAAKALPSHCTQRCSPRTR